MIDRNLDLQSNRVERELIGRGRRCLFVVKRCDLSSKFSCISFTGLWNAKMALKQYRRLMTLLKSENAHFLQSQPSPQPHPASMCCIMSFRPSRLNATSHDRSCSLKLVGFRLLKVSRSLSEITWLTLIGDMSSMMTMSTSK